MQQIAPDCFAMIGQSIFILHYISDDRFLFSHVFLQLSEQFFIFHYVMLWLQALVYEAMGEKCKMNMYLEDALMCMQSKKKENVKKNGI